MECQEHGDKLNASLQAVWLAQLLRVGHAFVSFLEGKLKKEINLTMREKFHWFLWKADISQCLIPPWGCIDSSPKNILQWNWSRFLASCFLASDFQNLVLARHFGSVWSEHTAFLWLYWLWFGTVRTNFSSAEPKGTWFLKDAPKIAHSVSFYAWEESKTMGHILVLAWIFWGHLGSSDTPRESSVTAWVMWEAKPDLSLVFCIKMVTLRRVGEGHWLVRRSLVEPALGAQSSLLSCMSKSYGRACESFQFPLG